MNTAPITTPLTGLRPAAADRLSGIVIRTHPHRMVAALLLTDVLSLALAGASSIWLRSVLSGTAWFPLAINVSLHWNLWPVLGITAFAYATAGLYTGGTLFPRVAVGPAEELRRTTLATTCIYGGLALAAFLLKTPAHAYSRAVIVCAWMLSLLLVPAGRALARALFARRDWWGFPVIVLGAGDTAAATIEKLLRHPELGLKPVAALDDNPRRRSIVSGVPVVGGLDFAPALAARFHIRYAVVAMPGSSETELLELYARYGDVFPHLLIVPALAGFSSATVVARDLRGLLALEVRQQLLARGPRFVKRVVDLVVAMAVGVLVLPAFGLLMLLIKLDSRGPVFFVQKRPGLRGRLFGLYKFRTMVDGAHREMDTLPEHMREEFEFFGKLKQDHRVTRIGRWLRRFSLDELPQLWNVMRGDMSLVGPRAYLLEQMPQVAGYEWLVFKVRPGLTGLWQVSGRNTVTFRERLDMDAYYVRNWSVWLDLCIVARTFWVVLSGKGAY